MSVSEEISPLHPRTPAPPPPSTGYIPIVYTGVRPGEKLHEELLGAGEEREPTSHPHIFRIRAGEGGGGRGDQIQSSKSKTPNGAEIRAGGRTEQGREGAEVRGSRGAEVQRSRGETG